MLKNPQTNILMSLFAIMITFSCKEGHKELFLTFEHTILLHKGEERAIVSIVKDSIDKEYALVTLDDNMLMTTYEYSSHTQYIDRLKRVYLSYKIEDIVEVQSYKYLDNGITEYHPMVKPYIYEDDFPLNFDYYSGDSIFFNKKEKPKQVVFKKGNADRYKVKYDVKNRMEARINENSKILYDYTEEGTLSQLSFQKGAYKEVYKFSPGDVDTAEVYFEGQKKYLILWDYSPSLQKRPGSLENSK